MQRVVRCAGHGRPNVAPLWAKAAHEAEIAEGFLLCYMPANPVIFHRLARPSALLSTVVLDVIATRQELCSNQVVRHDDVMDNSSSKLLQRGYTGFRV